MTEKSAAPIEFNVTMPLAEVTARVGNPIGKTFTFEVRSGELIYTFSGVVAVVDGDMVSFHAPYPSLTHPAPQIGNDDTP